MENKDLHIIIAQLDFMVGDIDANREQIEEAACQAADTHQADIIVFPELALTGYPPEDLLFRDSIRVRVERALTQLCSSLPSELYVLVGYPRSVEGRLFNAAGLIYNGQVIAEYYKQELPNYLVFDEKRYFTPGDRPCVVEINGVKAAITICEDIWHEGPMTQAKERGAQIMLNLNASPFHLGKEQERQDMLSFRAEEGGMPIVYTNLVGGQDELVFDGGSAVVSEQGEVVFRAPPFTTGLFSVVFVSNGAEFAKSSIRMVGRSVMPEQSTEESAYNALVLAVKDYVNKNGFKGAVLGLSGGVDSALTLAVAVDALGPDRVQAVMMPFRYTSQMSLDDAEEEANCLGVEYKVRPIEPMYEAFMATLETDFKDMKRDTTEENLQARCRGVLLMALSNKMGFIVLTTGNKSEMAVGYATLYGDMAGGFDVLKDVPKTLVFRLCEYRNSLTPDNPPIPQRVIDRPPSAELSPDQVDEDSLPPYSDLDVILELYVEKDLSADAIVAEGFDRDVVKRVIRLVDLNEYKRRQAPVGARVTSRGFGRDRRYPITCKWPAGD